MYDVTCQSSFENLQMWLKECDAYTTDKEDNIVKLLVANKIDLVEFFSFSLYRLIYRATEWWARATATSLPSSMYVVGEVCYP